ncbi:MAG TPA: ankyrin repeat domain-containing protein [Bryobacteraceae bacterium]|nr:ankyrin repeat domain-containing protein [Bryobacteraceae bacterium]
MRFALLIAVAAGNAFAADSPAATEILAKASRQGDLKMVQTILDAGFNPNLPDKYGQTALYYATAFNRLEIVQALLAHHADPNALAGKGVGAFPGSPLEYAVSLGNLRITSMLVAAGARMDAKDPQGRTVLHYSGCRIEMTQFLIREGADVNARDSQGSSPLDLAVQSGCLDNAAILIAHGARLNEVSGKTGATPINEAAWSGNAPLVQFLLNFNPDLGIPDRQGYRPLENAMRMGKEDSALLLLEAELKQPKPREFLEHTLDTAISKDEALLVAVLLRHGLPLNTPTLSGSTPVDKAALQGAIKVVRLLLENNADPNSALEDASLKGFPTIVSALLDHGARVNQVNAGSGSTALYAAASFGKADVVRLLLEHGANPSLCGSNHKSPYQAAAENGHVEIAVEILSHGGAKMCAAQ